MHRAGARFRADMQRLQGELWDDDVSLDLESMQDQHLKVGRGCSAFFGPFFAWDAVGHSCY